MRFCWYSTKNSTSSSAGCLGKCGGLPQKDCWDLSFLWGSPNPQKSSESWLWSSARTGSAIAKASAERDQLTSSIWIRRKWGISWNIVGISRSWSKNVQNAILLWNVAILLGYPTLGHAKNVTNPASDGLTFQKSRSNQGYDILFQKKIVRMATDGYSIRRLSVLNNWWVDNFEPTICEYHPRQFSANEPREYDIERRDLAVQMDFTPRKSRHVQLSDLLFLFEMHFESVPQRHPSILCFYRVFWKATSADASNVCISIVSICFGLVPSTKVSPKMGCVIDKILDAAFEIHMLRHWNRSFHDMCHGLILFIVP